MTSYEYKSAIPRQMISCTLHAPVVKLKLKLNYRNDQDGIRLSELTQSTDQEVKLNTASTVHHLVDTSIHTSDGQTLPILCKLNHLRH